MSRLSPAKRSPAASAPPFGDADLESTPVLLHRARRGESPALETLLARYIGPLRRFAHERLPGRARNLLDPDDLVQSAILRVLSHLRTFEPRHEGAFLAYLRQILLNHMRDEVRRIARTPRGGALPEDVLDPRPSPIEDAIGRETLARYEQALARLAPDCQEAVMLRLEMGCSYAQIAETQGRPSANAARLHTRRALLKLAHLLRSPDGSA